MALVASVKGVESVVNKLRKLAARSIADDNVSVVVGYTQAYGIYVHENLNAYHPVGQAKFLEQPLRENNQKYIDIVNKVVSKKGTLAQGLLMAGLALQRDSQQLVPVDTGALKGSAFTRVERGKGST